MSLKYFNIKVTLIYFLLLIPWPQTHIIKYFCSKDNSRLVRKIVGAKWTPILDKYSAKLPLECPLHPLRDIFAPCQDAKKRDRPTQWTCRLCGKSFYQERFLDLHFETRHKSAINEAEDSICLADFCDIMRCEVFQTEESSSLKTSDQHVVTEVEVWGDSLSQNSALAKANTPYLSLIPLRTSSIGGTRGAKVQNRQLCQDKIGQNKFKDTEEMNRAVCWYLSCDRYWEDGPLEPRYFPWGLLLILIFVLSTGVCFCYYIIWILFNSEETTINTDQQDYMYQRYPQMAHHQQQQPQQHQQQQQQHQREYATTGMHGGMRQSMSHPYYYQQKVQELYPEQHQYDYRHSPRRYMADSYTQNTSTIANMGGTPHRHRHVPTQSHVYQQDILDRRDYTNRPIATTAVTSVGGKSMSIGGGSIKSASTSGLGSSGVTMLDNEPNLGAALGSGGGGRHYNTHPRPLNSHHRNSGASQHSLRTSSSINEFMQNDIGQNEHYIYVTYPPDLKKRYFDKYE
ncbi:uncharacterized protein [Eurosta solidaginis]|uniref:uncharacterized protein isoform X3 n=1 Tax=Eurosta solidaginis TaxID=178769 RepID=UPI0035308B17